jgi:hypothetical protein
MSTPAESLVGGVLKRHIIAARFPATVGWLLVGISAQTLDFPLRRLIQKGDHILDVNEVRLESNATFWSYNHP